LSSYRRGIEGKRTVWINFYIFTEYSNVFTEEKVIISSKLSFFCEISFYIKSQKSKLSSSPTYEEGLVEDAWVAGDGARLRVGTVAGVR
jgi:hypothetical protein